MDASTLRGLSTLDPAAQVAEVHARTVTGYGGLSPLQVELSGPDQSNRLRATVRGWNDAQDPLEFAMVPTSGPALLSCGRDPEATTHWSVAP
jgi:hypothetical protein